MDTVGPPVQQRRPPELVERTVEVERLRALIAAAGGREGGVVVVRGPAGIGKTRLIEEAAAIATAAGFRRLSARGGQFESDFAFGVVRSLFEPLMRDGGDVLTGAAEFARPALELRAPSTPTPIAADPAAAIMHGLYWLTANLADERPLLATIDDAHWADALSLRFLEYLARRVRELPVLLVVGQRTGEPGGDSTALEALAGEAEATVLEPAPLGVDAVRALTAATMGDEPDPEFSAACLESTGGNPFLLGELLASLAASGVAPRAAAAGAVPDARPRTVTRALMLRLARLPEPCQRLAGAVAVLGDRVPLRHAAALAQLDETAAVAAADALAAMAILAPARSLEFTHPIVRGALLDQLPAARHALLHAEAARVLRDDGAPADAVAAHLLAAEPRGAAWTVEVLREAARGAVGRGGPDSAVALLQRALAEPPSSEQRPGVLLELGATEARAWAPGAIEHLQEARHLVSSPREHIEVAIELGRALLLAGRVPDALEAFEHGRALVADDHPELAFHLDLEFVGTARFANGTRDLAIERLDRLRDATGLSGAARLQLLANLALEAIGSETADRIVELSLAALSDGELIRNEGIDSPNIWFAIWPLVYCDRYDLVERQLATVFAEAARRGSGRAFSVACCVQAMAAYRTGALEEVQASAERAADVPGGIVTQPFAVDAQVRALLERGQPDEAAAALAAAGFAGEVPDTPMFWPVLSTRGLVKASTGDPAAGVEDCLLAGARAQAWRSRSPTLLPWRTDACVALLALGDRNEARRLAAEAVELARPFGAPRSLGIALRAAGVAEGGERGIELLRQAVAELAGSPAELEHAYAQIELGASLRRAGQRAEARDPLRHGMELAHRCGAEPAVARAREELLATGARPRRLSLTGRDALTPSERRIADMAATGLGNRDIAQALFLTVRTVEMHLTAAYRKLDIRSRKDLAGALSGSAGE